MTAPANNPAPSTSTSGLNAVQTGAQAVIADAVDPARRPDVLFRIRRDEDHQLNAWWMIGAFAAFSAGVIILMRFLPGGA